MHRVLSWKRLLILVGVLAAVSAGTFGVHALQSRRHADGLKEQAARAAADGQIEQALTLYERYLKFRPRDEDGFRKYVGLSFTLGKDDPARAKRAAELAEDFLRKFPPTHRRHYNIR